MGVPTSEVGYTTAMPRREDHEVHKDMWWHWGEGGGESSNALICNNDSSVNSHVGTDFQWHRFIMYVTSTRQASNRSCNNFAVEIKREPLSKFIPVKHTKNAFFSNSRLAEETGKRSTREKKKKFLAEFVKRNPT
jgi:hypothetical protein